MDVLALDHSDVLILAEEIIELLLVVLVAVVSIAEVAPAGHLEGIQQIGGKVYGKGSFTARVRARVTRGG